MGKRLPTDPMERVIAEALDRAGVRWESDDCGLAGLDFHLPDHGLYIEAKRLHSDRIAQQMSRAENVIAVQGMQAATWFAAMIAPKALAQAERRGAERMRERADEVCGWRRTMHLRDVGLAGLPEERRYFSILADEADLTGRAIRALPLPGDDGGTNQ